MSTAPGCCAGSRTTACTPPSSCCSSSTSPRCLLRRFDLLFDTPAPYIAAWHQAPTHDGGRDMAVHLELFTNRRSSGKLKYLAGSESGMDVFANDIAPEQAAHRLRSLGGAR